MTNNESWLIQKGLKKVWSFLVSSTLEEPMSITAEMQAKSFFPQISTKSIEI
jgi:hypothetical protein